MTSNSMQMWRTLGASRRKWSREEMTRLGAAGVSVCGRRERAGIVRCGLDGGSRGRDEGLEQLDYVQGGGLGVSQRGFDDFAGDVAVCSGIVVSRIQPILL
jgi:hypothetical protein